MSEREESEEEDKVMCQKKELNEKNVNVTNSSTSSFFLLSLYFSFYFLEGEMRKKREKGSEKILAKLFSSARKSF